MEHIIRERKITAREYEKLRLIYNRYQERLDAYAELLLWWNTKINLISREVSRETLGLHLLHSLCVSLAGDFEKTRRFIDAGSGGGLPAIPVAIAFEEKEILVNDIVAKKMFAVNDIIQRLSLKERVKTGIGSIENIELQTGQVVVTKHAFKIDELTELLRNSKWETIIFLKGKEEALRELEKVEGKKEVEIIDLETDFTGDFFSGKAVIQVKSITDNL